MADRHGKPFDEEEFETNWNDMDRNKDEVISEEELFEFMYAKAKAEGNIAEDDE